jgi:predicted esterase
MEHKLEHLKTFRYFTYGDSRKAKTIVIALHGYGQLSEYFIRKFQHLDPSEFFIVAPEGMHRFYLEGTSGRVGASWMTKESRLDDISDNISLLNELSLRLKSEQFERKILIGFSQGGATAARWHENGNFHAHHFILWASVFPPDLSLPEGSGSFHQSKNTLVIGNSDPYYDHNARNEMHNQLIKNGLDFKLVEFEGGHDIDKLTLEEVLRR